MISLPVEEVLLKADGRSVLVQTHNLATDALLWSKQKRGRLVLMQPLPPAVSPPYRLTKIVSKTRWRPQVNGGVSFRIQKTGNFWEQDKIALVYQRSPDLETFLLIIGATGSPGEESGVIARLQTNLQKPDDEEIRTHLTSDNSDAPGAYEGPPGHLIQAPQGSISLQVYVEEAAHASLVRISQCPSTTHKQ